MFSNLNTEEWNDLMLNIKDMEILILKKFKRRHAFRIKNIHITLNKLGLLLNIQCKRLLNFESQRIFRFPFLTHTIITLSITF